MAVLMDTRNGYIYGAAEVTAKQNILTNKWGETTAAESVRQQVETAVFEKLCGEFGQTWTKVLKQYAKGAPASNP